MKIKQTLVILALIVGLVVLFMGPSVYAADCNNDGVEDTSILPCGPDGKDNIWGLLRIVVNTLTAGIGIVAVAGVIYGAILYTSAGGSMEQIKQAKMIIYNVAIGLVTYAFMYSFLNFLIPGGLFN